MSDNDIKNTTKQKFKQLVKQKIKQQAFKSLMKKQNKSIKTTNLNYTKLKLQDYLKTESTIGLTKNKTTIFNIRVRMTKIKNNFKNQYKHNIKCRMNCGQIEDNQHILECTKLNKKQ